ncbi:MAG: AAA family ATPase [Sulfolobales archaeon]|nr:AAA family ATPase [Sulfolobales archaeon]MCX8185915.1 AAA family ATPase [Sulfolobales archaeon]MDW7969172.1 AAA family ATPase [Sulfolobales archaeon]
MSELVDRLRTFLDVLKDPFIGRDEEAKVVVLTLLAREHCTFIGEPGCVVGNTLISSYDGKLYHIDDIASGLPTGVYDVSFPVLPNAEATQLHIYKVREVVRVTTNLGFSLEVTPNHPIMTDRGWVEAKSLRPGDRVRLISQIPSPTDLIRIPARSVMLDSRFDYQYILFDELLSELLGIFLIRGALVGDYVEFSFKEGEDFLINHTINLIYRVIGKDLITEVRKTTNKYDVSVVENVRINSPYLRNILKALIIGSDKNRIPKVVLESPRRVSGAFLRALFETCGNLLYATSPSYNYGSYLILEGLKDDLLREVQVLLLRHGIIARVRSNNCIVKFKGSRCVGILEISDVDGLKKFKDDIGFISPTKNAALASLIKSLSDGQKYLKSQLKKQPIFDAVYDVSFISGSFNVYDFHIPVTHAFFTNGLLSHNTAKSALVRRAADLLEAKFFKYLLTRFTEPAEIFGPLDIRALHEGKYVRITYGKLPEADIAFLDEIFKANSAILNSLNTILQERILYDGYSEIKVPLWSLFGASNEVPDEPETEAFYDRFTMRHFVKPVSEDLWHDLLSKSWDLEVKLSLTDGYGREGKIMTIDHLRELHKSVLSVNVDAIKSKFVKLLAVLEGRGIHVTDRRKGKTLKIIAAHAMMNGRAVANEDDLIVIKYVVPKDQEELDKVNTILSEELKTPYKYLRELNEIKVNVKEILNYVSSLRNVESRFVEMRFREIYRDLEVTKERVISLMLESSNKDVEKVANEVIGLIDTAMEMIRGRIT